MSEFDSSSIDVSMSGVNPVVSSSSCTNINSPYAAGRVNKLNNHWMPQHYSGDRAIRESWSLMTARIRDLVRSDSVLTKCKQSLQRLVIGTGIQCFSSAGDLEPDNEELFEFELEADTWFERWALEEADSEGEHSFWEMQNLGFGDEVEAGNCLWLEVIDNSPDRTVPLCYQLIEWEQIDMNQDRDAALSRSGKGRRYNRIQNGIEYDSRGRKVAFYLYDNHPFNGQYSFASRRIPASQVIHEYSSPRPSAKMGVTWFAPLAQGNKDFDRLVANELTSRALQALMAVAVYSPDAQYNIGLDAEDPATGVKNFKLGYPFIGQLGAQDKVEVVESKRSTADNQPLQNLLLNLQAMGCGISVNRLLGDPSKANLAALKSAHQDDDANMAPIQMNFARKVVRRIRKQHMKWAFARGLFRSYSASDYQRKQWQFNQFSIIPSGRVDLDKDDGEAAIDRMRSGLSTYQDECARRGRHWRRNLMRMRQVGQLSDKMGVVLDWTKGQGQVPDSSTTIAGDEKNQAEESTSASQP